MQAETQTKSEILDLMNEYKKAYAEKNINSIIKIIPEDDDMIFVGSGQDEWVQGFEEIKKGFERDFEQADSINIEFSKIPVFGNGNVAWTTTTMNMEIKINGNDLNLNGRLSVVFEKRNDNWLIVQLHYSMAVVEQKTGQSYPNK
ncbi:MAG: nuclear transport factor 2 family protein [Methanobacteriaceae archaeon]|jgi:ketosteroid isomerase-like protein|nr:nuclear transport factor 2 family protein [Methanobacteriaceae archaeon]MDO9627611.1 nuclear transport factor 2 family protein [Methanobacteriaceae archaeon]